MPSASWPISSLPSTFSRAVRSAAPLAICRTRSFSSLADFTTLLTIAQPIRPNVQIASTESAIVTFDHVRMLPATSASVARVASLTVTADSFMVFEWSR